MPALRDLKAADRLTLVRAEIDRRDVERGGLSTFVQKAFRAVEPGTPYVHNWHVDAMAEALTDVSMGKTRELAIHVPPGCMKSLTVSILWPVWEWVYRPNTRFFSISYLPDLALDHTRRSRDLMHGDWFRQRWGDAFTLPAGCPAGEYENDRFGWRYSASVGGGITGWHCDTMIVDDPINPKDLTEAGLKTATAWWNVVRPTRYRDVKTSRTVLVMQRLHEADPGAIAKEQGFTVISLPMRYEPKAAWARDPRKEDGALLWPEKFPDVEIQKVERNMGPLTTAAQYQQRPTPAGGLIFKSSWFRTWRKKGEGGIPIEEWTALPDKFDRVIQSWDCTFKGVEDSDFVVGQVWGVKGPDFFLLDQFREQTNVLGTCAAILAMTKTWPRATAILIEDKANGPAVIDILAKKVRGMIAVTPEGGKYARANAVATFFESGNVYHPDPVTVPWVPHHRHELTTFPMAAHDDTVDATSQALTWLHNNKGNLGAAMEALAKMGGAEALFNY